MKKQSEQVIKIKTADGFLLYGNYKKKRNAPLFVIVHGLPGSMDEGLYRAATEWFFNHGFATFRFNLYGPQKNARQLMNSTLRTHSEDLDTVIRYFKKRGVRDIFVAGHSFGGLTILHSKEQGFKGAALWDPSYKISFAKKAYGLPGGKYAKEIQGYVMRWGMNVVISKTMAHEVDSLPWDTLGKKFKVPTVVIVAGNGLLKSAKKYHENIPAAKKLFVVPGATHYFDDAPGMQEKIFEATAKWFLLIRKKAAKNSPVLQICTAPQKV